MGCIAPAYRVGVLLVLPALACCGFAAGAGNGQVEEAQRTPIAGPVPVAPNRWEPEEPSGSATTTTLTLSAAQVEAGAAVTLTAKVTAGKTTVEPGIVHFCNAAASACTGADMLAEAVLGAKGEASRVLVIPAGSYSVKASFAGTTPYGASESAAQSLAVKDNSTYSTKATLTSTTGSEGKFALGAVLTSHAPASPTGSLTFADTTHKISLGSVTLRETPAGGYQPFGLISTGAGSGPNDLAIGDFNGDGIPDLAVPDSASGVVAVFLGKGDGTFQAAVSTSTGSGSMPLAVAVGDFNADGKPDLAVAVGNRGAVAILLGNGDGTFQSARMVATAGSGLYYPLGLVVADLNHDGRLDIATANNSYGVSVLLGNGDGTFQPYRLLGSSQQPTWITAGDFNNDGNLDLAVTTSSDTVDISLGNGDGTFQKYTSISLGSGTNPQSVAAADLDGDGNVDLVVACYGANALGVLLGNGDGTFAPAELYATGAGAIAVAVADLNLDGIPDVVVTNLNAGSLSLFQGNGDGTFLPLPGYAMPRNSQPAATVVADLDAEGAPEFVSVLYGSSALYVLEPERMQGVLLEDVALSAAGTTELTASFAGDDQYAPATSAAYPYTGTPATTAPPVFSPPAGSYTGKLSVTLNCATAGATIYYTLNGAAPTTSSRQYGGAILLTANTTIEAMALGKNAVDSAVVKSAYTIKETGTECTAIALTPTGDGDGCARQGRKRNSIAVEFKER